MKMESGTTERGEQCQRQCAETERGSENWKSEREMENKASEIEREREHDYT